MLTSLAVHPKLAATKSFPKVSVFTPIKQFTYLFGLFNCNESAQTYKDQDEKQAVGISCLSL